MFDFQMDVMEHSDDELQKHDAFQSKRLHMKTLLSFPLSLFLTLSVSLSASAQPKYPVSAIPQALLQDAHAVLRTEEINIELTSGGEMVRKRKFALTILDEAGKAEAKLVVGYDRLHKVTAFEGALYNGAGVQIKS